jgi:hypothetical protein
LVKPQQGLHHREGDHLGVAGARHDPDLRTDRDTLGMGAEQIVGRHIKCSEGVQIGVHQASMA